MLSLVDRPLLRVLVRSTFERHGSSRAIISCGYIRTRSRRRSAPGHDGCSLEYAIEGEPLGQAVLIGFAGA
jgi:hypothetical protein